MWRASLARLLPEYIMLDHWAEEPVRVVGCEGGELPTKDEVWSKSRACPGARREVG